MNDFTKEELEEIKRCLKYMIDGGVTPYSCVTLDVKKKIQLMIDNYDKHKFKVPDEMDSSALAWKYQHDE